MPIMEAAAMVPMVIRIIVSGVSVGVCGGFWFGSICRVITDVAAEFPALSYAMTLYRICVPAGCPGIEPSQGPCVPIKIIGTVTQEAPPSKL